MLWTATCLQLNVRFWSAININHSPRQAQPASHRTRIRAACMGPILYPSLIQRRSGDIVPEKRFDVVDARRWVSERSKVDWPTTVDISRVQSLMYIFHTTLLDSTRRSGWVQSRRVGRCELSLRLWSATVCATDSSDPDVIYSWHWHAVMIRRWSAMSRCRDISSDFVSFVTFLIPSWWPRLELWWPPLLTAGWITATVC
jgi:hypothetical protein